MFVSKLRRDPALEETTNTPNKLLKKNPKNKKPIFPGSLQSNMSLSHEPFPEPSILLTWRHSMKVGSRAPRFGPWLLPFTSHVALGESLGSSEPWSHRVWNEDGDLHTSEGKRKDSYQDHDFQSLYKLGCKSTGCLPSTPTPECTEFSIFDWWLKVCTQQSINHFWRKENIPQG